MARIFSPIHTFCSAVTATGAGAEMNVKEYSKIIIEVIGGSGVTATLSFKGAFPDRSPAWASAASATNNWSTLGYKNMVARTVVAGSSTLAIATGTTQIVEIDTGLIGKINVTVDSVSGGSVTVRGWAISE